MKTSTNSLGETTWTLTKVRADGTLRRSVTRRNDGGFDLMGEFFPKRRDLSIEMRPRPERDHASAQKFFREAKAEGFQ